MDTFLNKSQKKTFYLFLSFYIISSYILLGTIAYIYYESQKQYLHVNVHYQLHEKADDLLNEIDTKQNTNILKNNYSNKDTNVEFLDYKGNVFGSDKKHYVTDNLNRDVCGLNHQCLLFKKTTSIDKNIWGFVLTDQTLKIQTTKLKKEILIIFALIAIVVAFIGYTLSMLFLKPINNYIETLNTFIKDINHELNTPMTSLVMASKELNNSYDKRYVKSIIISTKQLFEIYKSLIEINFDTQSKLEELDLKELVNESIEYFNEILISKKITVNIDLETTYYEANKEKIQRVLNNLISNAIKHSYPASSINITLKDKKLSVENFGMGIKKEEQSKIFERFYRVNEYTRGFGIGLDVIRRICFQYNIKISLHSQEKKNTIFTLDFTLSKS
jgi:two-component system OmpR family sensor kinase